MKVGEDQTCTILCTQTLTKAQIKTLLGYIKSQYRVHWYVFLDSSLPYACVPANSNSQAVTLWQKVVGWSSWSSLVPYCLWRGETRDRLALGSLRTSLLLFPEPLLTDYISIGGRSTAFFSPGNVAHLNPISLLSHTSNPGISPLFSSNCDSDAI